MSDDPLHLLRHRLYYRVGAAVSGLNTMPFYISPRRALLDDLGFDNWASTASVMEVCFLFELLCVDHQAEVLSKFIIQEQLCGQDLYLR